MKRKTRSKGQRSIVAWVLGIIAGFVPLVVRLKALKVPKAGQEVWDNGTGLYADFFSANKVIMLGILTMIALVFFVVEYEKGIHRIKEQEKKLINNNKLIIILLGSYLGFATLSTIFAASGTKLIALLGGPGRYEGLIAVIFYLMLMVFGVYIGKETENVKLIYKLLTAGALVLGIIGITQFFGWDFLQSDGGKSLILPFEYQHLAGDMNFPFAGRVYGTLFNPNYVGSYAAMLMPVSLIGVIYTYLYSKDKMKKLNATIMALIMIALWMIPYSRGGLLGGGIAILMILIILNKHLFRTKMQIGLFIVTACIAVVGLNFVSKGVILTRVKTLADQAKSFISSDQKEIAKLTDIRLEDEAVEIDSNLPSFRVELKSGNLLMKDGQGHVVELAEKDKRYTPTDEKYSGMNIRLLAEDQFEINIKNPDLKANYKIYLVHTPYGMRVVGHGSKLYSVVPVPSWGFEGKEKLGSSRGYIWSRTIPMIWEKWLLGYGLDTYVLSFPQHDIVGKINAYGRTNIITDKPHNLYLQTMVSTGVPSMLILITLFVIYTIRCISHIRNSHEDDIRRWMSIGIFAALCGYLVAGFFNDSVVSVAPVFWILWGLGIGLTSLPEDIKGK